MLILTDSITEHSSEVVTEGTTCLTFHQFKYVFQNAYSPLTKKTKNAKSRTNQGLKVQVGGQKSYFYHRLRCRFPELVSVAAHSTPQQQHTSLMQLTQQP